MYDKGLNKKAIEFGGCKPASSFFYKEIFGNRSVFVRICKCFGKISLQIKKSLLKICIFA